MTDNLHPAAAAHAALADVVRAAKPLASAHTELCKILDEQVRIAPDGEVKVLEADGSLMLDGANGFVNATPQTLMRRLRHDRPELFGEKPAKAPTPTPDKPATLGEAMYAARRGDPSILADFEERYRLPQVASKVNMTELWAKAKSGNVAARQKLESILKV